MRTHSHIGIDSLEPRRLLSTVNPNADPVMDNDGVPDLRITGDTGGDFFNNIDVYIDFQNTRTIVHDDINNIGTVEAGELYVYQTLFETIDFVTNTQADVVRVFFVNDFGCRVPVEVTSTTPISLNGKGTMGGLTGSGSTVGVMGLAPTLAARPAALPVARAVLPVTPTGLPYAGEKYFDPLLSIYANLGSGNDTFWIGTRITGSTPDNPTTGFNESVPFDPDGANICCADLVVEADGGTNDDRLDFDLRRTSIYGSLVTLNADGSDHNDQINLWLPDYYHGATPELDGVSELQERISSSIYCDGGGIDDNVGGAGPDQIIEETTPTFLDVNFQTGTGTNTVNITALTTVVEDGSIVDIDIEGNSGVDTVNANMGIVLLSSPAILAPDGSGIAPSPNLVPEFGNPAEFYLDAVLGGSNDRFQANYHLERAHFYLQEGTLLHIGALGGDGADWLRVDNVAPAGSILPLYGTLDFNFGGGNHNDEVQVQLDSPVEQEDSIQYFNETGVVKVYLNGDGGDDFVEFDEQVAGCPLLDVMVMGGNGNDRLVLAVNVADALVPAAVNGLAIGGGPRYPSPRNAMLIDGGSGYDQWDEDGNFTLFTLRGVEQENDALETNDPTVPEVYI